MSVADRKETAAVRTVRGWGHLEACAGVGAVVESAPHAFPLKESLSQKGCRRSEGADSPFPMAR